MRLHIRSPYSAKGMEWPTCNQWHVSELLSLEEATQVIQCNPSAMCQRCWRTCVDKGFLDPKKCALPKKTARRALREPTEKFALPKDVPVKERVQRVVKEIDRNEELQAELAEIAKLGF